MSEIDFFSSPYQYSRLDTIEVDIGGIPLGRNNAIRIQSMTSTPTQNIEATVAQSIRINKAGGDYVRITTPALKDVEALKEIKVQLHKKGYVIPLIADIHFNPKVAMAAASIVEKVRINPGNFADKKKFSYREYADKEYQDEIDKIHTALLPLLKVCKENQTAIRLGVNHGSLSDRIISKYGDTPEGMAESVMEFIRICRAEDFHQLVLSMKASNTLIMVQATRLLVKKMKETGICYPLHLGVTEASEGEDGRIKSAVGIGTLLADGIGDTIRVSLTEEPEKEIPVAQILVNKFRKLVNTPSINYLDSYPVNPFNYQRRKSWMVDNIGGSKVPVIIHTLEECNFSTLSEIGWNFHPETKSWSFNDQLPDYLFLNEFPENMVLPEEIGAIIPFKKWHNEQQNSYPLLTGSELLLVSNTIKSALHFVQLQFSELTDDILQRLKADTKAVIICGSKHINVIAEIRAFFSRLMHKSIQNPVIIKNTYGETNLQNLQIAAACDFGALFLDGLGDGLWLENKGSVSIRNFNSMAFGILQACRVRISKTEYISCPSCGRTQFDIQKTVAQIRAKTAHLKGLKIGIMGCIVNGLGEMADADFGYIGSGKGKITLYKGPLAMQKNVPEEEAVDALIELLKKEGDWKAP